MAVSITLSAVELSSAMGVSLVPLGLGPAFSLRRGRTWPTLHKRFVVDVQRALLKPDPELLSRALSPATRELRILPMELHSEGGSLTIRGRVALVLESRSVGNANRTVLAYCPTRPDDWFALGRDELLSDEALRLHAERVLRERLGKERYGEVLSLFLQNAADETMVHLPRTARLRTSRLMMDYPSLLDFEPPDPRVLLGQSAAPPSLFEFGDNLVEAATDSPRRRWVSRPQLDQTLDRLLSASPRRSVLLVGPPGVGKTALLESWVTRHLTASGYETHRNVGLVPAVVALQGNRLLAGMSYVGDWEKRVLSIVTQAEKKGALLYFSDLSRFGRLGQSRTSQRSFADLFWAPVEARTLTLIGECTDGELSVLRAQAPRFAELFSIVRVEEPPSATTRSILLETVRADEVTEKLHVDREVLTMLLRQSTHLSPGRANPGAVVDWARRAIRRAVDTGKKEVPASFVEAVVAADSGLRPEELRGDALDREGLEARLARRVLGQPEAVKRARDAIVRYVARVSNPRRPSSIFLFVGPTGTGKTELCKAMCGELFGSEEKLIRFDMGEYQHADAVARLIGDFYQPDGALTRSIRSEPHAVLLLDEIEKAHPSVLTLLLAIFEEGELTNASGQKSYFGRCIIVLTSNLGSGAKPRVGFDGERDESAPYRDATRSFFAPELLGRIDAIVPFASLGEAEACAIVGKVVREIGLRNGLTERGIVLAVHPKVVRSLAREAFSAEGGARTLKRFLENRVTARLAEYLAGTTRVALEQLRLLPRGEGFVIVADRADEAPSLAGSLLAEQLVTQTDQELVATAKQAIAELEELALPQAPPSEPAFQDGTSSFCEQPEVDTDAAFYGEQLRARARSLADELSLAVRGAAELWSEQLEAHLEDKTRTVSSWYRRRARDARRMLALVRQPETTGPSVPRRRLVDLLHSAAFLTRCSDLVTQGIAEHDVLFELVCMGDPTLFRETLEAVYRFADMQGLAVPEAFEILPAERACVRSREEILSCEPSGHGERRAVLLRVVGLGARALWEGEEGTSSMESGKAGLCATAARVAARPRDVRASEAAQELLARVTAVDLGLPPLVRTITQRSDPSMRRAVVEIVDYPTSLAFTMHDARVRDALVELWRLRATRTERGS